MQEAGWVSGAGVDSMEILAAAGLYPWTVQPIASPCTDKAIPTAILGSTKTLFSQPEDG